MEKNADLKIGVIADLHHGYDLPTRRGSLSLTLLEDFIHDMNEEFKADLVFDLGDRIQDIDPELDYQHMQEVKRAYEKLNAPIYYLLGNHDLRNLSKKDNNDIFGQKMGYYTFHFKGFQFFILDGQDPVIKGIGGSISDEQLAQFAEDLKADNCPAVVFIHQPLDDQNISSNVHFVGIEELAYIANRKQIRDVILASPRVLAVINGHVHWSKLETIEGIPFISIPSFIESWDANLEPQKAYGKVYLSEGKVSVEFVGMNPK